MLSSPGLGNDSSLSQSLRQECLSDYVTSAIDENPKASMVEAIVEEGERCCYWHY